MNWSTSARPAQNAAARRIRTARPGGGHRCRRCIWSVGNNYPAPENHRRGTLKQGDNTALACARTAFRGPISKTRREPRCVRKRMAQFPDSCLASPAPSRRSSGLRCLPDGASVLMPFSHALPREKTLPSRHHSSRQQTAQANNTSTQTTSTLTSDNSTAALPMSLARLAR